MRSTLSLTLPSRPVALLSCFKGPISLVDHEIRIRSIGDRRLFSNRLRLFSDLNFMTFNFYEIKKVTGASSTDTSIHGSSTVHYSPTGTLNPKRFFRNRPLGERLRLLGYVLPRFKNGLQ